jgi:pimeloyl-ACP methyl ester carboxylesterase
LALFTAATIVGWCEAAHDRIDDCPAVKPTLASPTGSPSSRTRPIRLYAWEKYLPSREGSFAGTILLVHGSSMASTPTFDLQVPGHGETHSPMDYFARLGYDVWCFDCEGYGRSDETRDTKFYVADGADDTEAVAGTSQVRGDEAAMFGGSSSAAAATPAGPDPISGVILDASSDRQGADPEQRRKRLPEYLRRIAVDVQVRPPDLHARPRGDCRHAVVGAFAGDLRPGHFDVNGTYVDMCEPAAGGPARSTCHPDPAQRYDRIASFDDLLEFLAHQRRQTFIVIPGLRIADCTAEPGQTSRVQSY